MMGSQVGPFGLDLPAHAHLRNVHGDLVEVKTGLQGETSSLPLNMATFTFATDANATLTQAQYAAPVLLITGAVISTTRNIVVPVQAGAFLIVDNREGHSVQIIGATGTGVTVATVKKALLYCDGTNWLRLTADT